MSGGGGISVLRRVWQGLNYLTRLRQQLRASAPPSTPDQPPVAPRVLPDGPPPAGMDLGELHSDGAWPTHSLTH